MKKCVFLVMALLLSASGYTQVKFKDKPIGIVNTHVRFMGTKDTAGGYVDQGYTLGDLATWLGTDLGIASLGSNNIAQKSLTATGDFVQDWSGRQLIFSNVRTFGITDVNGMGVIGIDTNGPLLRSGALFQGTTLALMGLDSNSAMFFFSGAGGFRGAAFFNGSNYFNSNSLNGFVYGHSPTVNWFQLLLANRLVVSSDSVTGINSFNGVAIYSGTGSPEGVVTAAIGSVYTDSSGGVGTTFYVKESGTGNTGWTAQSASGGTFDASLGLGNITNKTAKFYGSTDTTYVSSTGLITKNKTTGNIVTRVGDNGQGTVTIGALDGSAGSVNLYYKNRGTAGNDIYFHDRLGVPDTVAFFSDVIGLATTDSFRFATRARVQKAVDSLNMVIATTTGSVVGAVTSGPGSVTCSSGVGYVGIGYTPASDGDYLYSCNLVVTAVSGTSVLGGIAVSYTLPSGTTASIRFEKDVNGNTLGSATGVYCIPSTLLKVKGGTTVGTTVVWISGSSGSSYDSYSDQRIQKL